MEENQNSDKINTEEIKKQATDTAKEVKEAVKNADFKKDVNATKGFLSNLFKNPINEIEKVAKSNKNEFLKIAIIVLVIWLVSVLIGSLISVFNSYSSIYGLHMSFGTFLKNSVNNVFSIVKSVISPVLSVVILSGIVYMMSKDKKRPFVQIITSIVIAKIPVVLASVLSLLGYISQVYKITSPFSGFCNVISIVLVYFTIKSLYTDDANDNVFIKNFAIIMGIFYVAKFIISFFGVSI